MTPIESQDSSGHPSVRSRRRKSKHSDDEDAKIAASYSRYSSDQQADSSLDDQQRKCRERAQQDGFEIRSQFEFSDAAVSGTLLHREGLDRLLEAAAAREFCVVYFHSLSRLARETVISMPLLKELVYVHHVRIISVTEGIDSDNSSWVMLATMSSLQHEHYVKELSANVFRGQEGTVLARFSVGDFRFGYTSVPSPGGEVVGRGREQKPRMVYAVHPEQCRWVQKIFEWFVIDRRSIAWIVREMNRQKVSKDHRSSTSQWRRDSVIGVLRSPKYIGLWHWGRMKNARNPSTGQVSQVERDCEEIAQYSRHFPDLQIIDDTTFDEAQKLLDQSSEDCRSSRKKNGQLNGSSKGSARGHLLAGLVRCSCGASLNVGGSRGAYLFCPAARDGRCERRTQLPRQLATDLILGTVGQRILDNPTWCSAVHASCLEAWQRDKTTEPDERAELEKKISDRNQKIQRILDYIENTDHPMPEFGERLAANRAEKLTFERRLKILASKPPLPQVPPTKEWITERLRQLGEVLHAATPAASEALKNLLDGPMVVEEVSVENRKRRFWRGTFVIRLGAVRQSVSSESESPTDSGGELNLSEKITLDFRRRTNAQAKGDEAWALYQQGILHNHEIAQRIGVSKSRLTHILQLAARERNQPLEDGRRRRHTLENKTEVQLAHARLVEDIKLLWDTGLELSQIAARLKICRDTVTNAIREWHVARSLPVPDGRTRRWTLPRDGSDGQSASGHEGDTNAA